MPTTPAFVLGLPGTVENWDQEVAFVYSGSTPGEFKVTPSSGKLRISRYDPAIPGKLYWNGTAFTTTYVELATTIVGVVSHYGFTIPSSMPPGTTILFEGWINNDPTTMGTVAVQCGAPVPASAVPRLAVVLAP